MQPSWLFLFGFAYKKISVANLTLPTLPAAHCLVLIWPRSRLNSIYSADDYRDSQEFCTFLNMTPQQINAVTARGNASHS